MSTDTAPPPAAAAVAKKAPTRPPVNPSTFDVKVAQIDTRIGELTIEQVDYLAQLAEDPTNSNVDAMLGSVEAEIATLRAQRERLLMAREEAARRFNVAAHAAFVTQLKADALAVDRMGDEMFELTALVAKQIRGLRPLLQKLEDLGEQRAAMAWGVLRSACGADPAERARWVSAWRGQREAATLRTGPLALLIEAALRDAGIGKLGPTTAITVPAAPTFMGRDRRYVFSGGRNVPIPGGKDESEDWKKANADAIALAKEEHDRAAGRLATAMAVSIKSTAEGLPT